MPARTSPHPGEHTRPASRTHSRNVSFNNPIHGLRINLDSQPSASPSPEKQKIPVSFSRRRAKSLAHSRARVLDELSELQRSLTTLARRDNEVVEVFAKYPPDDVSTHMGHIRRISGVPDHADEIAHAVEAYTLSSDGDDCESCDPDPGSPDSSTTYVEEDSLSGWDVQKLGSPAPLPIPDMDVVEHFSMQNPELRAALALLAFDMKLTLRALLLSLEIPRFIPLWYLPLSAVLLCGAISFQLGLVI